MGGEVAPNPQDFVEAFWFACWFGVALVAFFYLTHRGAEGAPMRWQRWRDAFAERYLLSSTAVSEDTDDDIASAQNGVLSPAKRSR